MTKQFRLNERGFDILSEKEQQYRIRLLAHLGWPSPMLFMNESDRQFECKKLAFHRGGWVSGQNREEAHDVRA